MLKKNGICYKICNSSTIELTTEHYVEPVISDFNIVELKIRDESIKLKQSFKFPLGDRILPYEINHITKIDKKTYLLHTEIRNKTTQYILPILEKVNYPHVTKRQFDKETLKDLEWYCKGTYLINAYLGGENKERLDGYLYLKYRFSPHIIYQTLEENIVNVHPLFVKVIDLGDTFTYIKFRIPVEFMDDIGLFLDGRYSKFTLQFKRRVVDFYSLNPKSNMFQILTGGNEYRAQLSKELGFPIDGELDSIPDINNELIRL
jgi:hypothetical protein